MRLDALVRLIDSADFSSFRELATHCLALKGYQEVTLVDGWNDGGTDVRVFQLPPNPTQMAFQITVERDWKGKIWEDAAKAKNRLNLHHMTLVTCHRVPEAEFFRETENIWREHGVRATKLDGPAIASTFFLEGTTGLVLRLLGIEVADSSATVEPSARANAAYSFAFFGADTHNFRESAIESAIVAIAGQRTRIERAELERDVRSLLNVGDQMSAPVASAIDRMIQRGDMSGPASSLTLSPNLAEAASSMALLRKRDWQELQTTVRTMLNEARLRPTQDRVDQVLSDVGALLVDVAQNAIGSLASRPPAFATTVKQRLRHLHATLDSMGFPEGAIRNKFLEDLARSATNLPIGKCLIAGELFLSLTPLNTPQLIRALGGRADIATLLDASVAIPMLTGLLFRPVASRFSIAAEHAYSQLKSHGLAIQLPMDYLEEVAAHLLHAYRDYAAIIDVDQDLTSSENAFVAHFASQRLDGDETPFDDFVEMFGLTSGLRDADFQIALGALKPKLQRLFDHYSIRTVPLHRPSATAQRRAEEAIAHALLELGIERPDILARHDARTLAFLFDSDGKTDTAHVFCTWDGVHFKARERETAEWLALNPAVYGDILSMASAAPGPIASPVVFARALSEEAAERGARVWDQIARIERGSMRDAELLTVARQFKEEYVSNTQSGQQAEAIRKSWAAWKSKHYVKEAPTSG